MVHMRKMMNVWNKLIEKIEIDDIKTNLDLYKIIKEWLIENKTKYFKNVYSDYDLDFFISLNPDDYAIDFSECSVEDSLTRIEKFEPRTIDNIVMITRDILWGMVAYKSKVECPNCTEDDFRVLYEQDTMKIVLSCDLCGWAQFEDGECFMAKQGDSNQKLLPLKMEQLKGKYVKKNKGLYFFPITAK